MNKVYTPKEYTNKELKNKSGIYQIRNLQTDKLYIGSATDLYERKSQHFSLLKYGKHNHKLQNSYNLYNKENFIFEVIEFIENKDKLLESEQYWMDRFLVYERDKGYNVQPIAGKTIVTDSIRQKMSENHADVSGSKNPSSQSVVRLEDKKIFSTMKEAVEKSKLKYISQICIACNSKNHIAGSYHWLYEKDYINKTNEEIDNIINIKKKSQQRIYCVETGIIYNSLIEANKHTGIGVNIIAQHCKNTRPKHLKDKFTWKYI